MYSEATTASGAAATGGGGDSNGDNDDAAPSPTQSSAGKPIQLIFPYTGKQKPANAGSH